MSAPKEDKKERRKRTRESIQLLLRRVRHVCGLVGHADDIADRIEAIVDEVLDFVNGPDARDLVPEADRRRVQDAAQRFRGAKDKLDTFADACDRLTKALDAVEKILVPGGLSLALAAAAIVVLVAAGVGIAVAVVLISDGDNGGVPAGPAVLSDPTNISSPSHDIGVPSENPIVTVTWSLHEGAAAFATDWTGGRQDMPDTQPDLPGDATEATSPELADGEWYFHLRTQGKDGRWTSTVHIGPFVIAGCPPLEDAFLRAQSRDANQIDLSWGSTGGCEPFDGTITATYSTEDSPYTQYDVTEPSGSHVDEPPVRCEGTFDIVYMLTLTDRTGQTVDASARSSVTWIC